MKKVKLLLASFLLLVGNVLLAQTIRVTGTVTDASDGAPVIGAAVKILGTSSGTVTDFDGKYVISVNSGQILEFSYIGMKTKTVRVENVLFFWKMLWWLLTQL